MNFFKKPDPKEILREQNKELRKAGRDVDLTQRDLEKQEKDLINNIKKAAKENNKQLCNIYAKDLVRIRNQKARCCKVNSQINTIGSQTKVMGANQALAGAMSKTSGIMKKMNDQNKSAELMRTLEEFSKQNRIMDMKDELINETLKEALGDSDDEQEEEAVMQKVLDEIGIEITGRLANAKSAKVAEKPSAKQDEMTDDFIEKELAKLRM